MHIYQQEKSTNPNGSVDFNSLTWDIIRKETKRMDMEWQTCSSRPMRPRNIGMMVVYDVEDILLLSLGYIKIRKKKELKIIFKNKGIRISYSDQFHFELNGLLCRAIIEKCAIICYNVRYKM